MAKNLMTPEEGRELDKLEQERVAALERARLAILCEGMDSAAYLKADAEMGVIVRRQKEILGLAAHWMA